MSSRPSWPGSGGRGLPHERTRPAPAEPRTQSAARSASSAARRDSPSRAHGMRVVLVRLSALGDIVHTWPLAVALAAGVPDLHLTWVVEEPLVPLVKEHPAVDAVIAVATRRWRRHPAAARTRAEIAVVRARLRELSADVCVDAQGLVKSALVARWSAAPVRVGFARPWRREVLAGLVYTRTVPGSRDDLHVVASNLALVRAFGLDPPRPDAQPRRPVAACASNERRATGPFDAAVRRAPSRSGSPLEVDP